MEPLLDVKDYAPRAPKPTNMKPVIVLVAIAGGVFAAWHYWPKFSSKLGIAHSGGPGRGASHGKEQAIQITERYLEQLLSFPIDPVIETTVTLHDDGSPYWMLQGTIQYAMVSVDKTIGGRHSSRGMPKPPKPQVWRAVVFTDPTGTWKLRYMYVKSHHNDSESMGTYYDIQTPAVSDTSSSPRDRWKLIVHQLQRLKDTPQNRAVVERERVENLKVWSRALRETQQRIDQANEQGDRKTARSLQGQLEFRKKLVEKYRSPKN